MGRVLKYKPGSFYRTDDRTGFPTRAEDTRQEWNGLIVDKRRWEPRQPQDLVRGRPDNQTVPKPRPLGPNIQVGPWMIALSATALVGATFIPLGSIQTLNDDDPVGIIMDNGEVFFTTINGAPLSNGVNIDDALPHQASSGNLFINYAPEPVLNVQTGLS